MSSAEERMAGIDERLVDLETKLVYQEDALQQLNAVVLEQRRQIEQLTATTQVLGERVRALGESPGHDGPEVPPHY